MSAPGNVDMSFGYDGQLLDITAWTGPVTASLRHVRDNDFRVTGEFVDDDFFLARSYDFDGFLQSSGPLQLTRDPSHGAVVGSDAGVVQQAMTLNQFGEPATVAWRVSGVEALGFTYTRDKLGRIVSREERRAGTSRVFDYSYDVAGRLVVVEEDGAVSATYTYDDNGNRTDATRQLDEVVAVVDEQDRLLSNGSFTYGWDADGALVSRTDASTNATTRFAYDTLGGLRQVTLSDGRVIDYVIDYVIDGLGRRVGKRVDGVLQQGFVYDGQLRIVAELDGSGVVRRRYVYSSHANVPDIAIDVLTGETWRIITDHLGSPRLVVDIDDGTIVAEREFDEFGRVVSDSAPGLLPFGFAGGLEDPDTGLVRFGARDYDPESGRWTAKDPIGFASGDTNNYAYVAGDPVNRTDPSGLAPGDEFATLAGACMDFAISAEGTFLGSDVGQSANLYETPYGTWTYDGLYTTLDDGSVDYPDARRLSAPGEEICQAHTHPPGRSDSFSPDIDEPDLMRRYAALAAAGAPGFLISQCLLAGDGTIQLDRLPFPLEVIGRLP